MSEAVDAILTAAELVSTQADGASGTPIANGSSSITWSSEHIAIDPTASIAPRDRRIQAD